MTQLYRRLFGVGAVVAAVMSVSAGARADFKDGRQLLQDCARGSGRELYCEGYIAAVADAELKQGGDLGDTICRTEEIKLGQMKDVVVLYLTSHPETRDYAAVSLVARALADAFLCR